jgi:RimJ/RimL family protein N-acetyltransferase
VTPPARLAAGAARLRLAGPGDLDAFHALLTDPEVARFLCDGRLLSRAEAAAALDRHVAEGAEGLGLWLIEAEGGAVGFAGLSRVPPETSPRPGVLGEVEPIVALAPAFWGRGLASAALGALLAHADDGLGLARTVAIADAPNHRSRRMLARAGYVAFGEAPGAFGTMVLHERARSPARGQADLSCGRGRAMC